MNLAKIKLKPGVYSESSRTSEIKLFTKIVIKYVILIDDNPVPKNDSKSDKE